MGRKVAALGLVLALVGVLVTTWSQPPPRTSVTAPVDHVSTLLLGLLPLLGSVLAGVGAVVAALGLALALTGRDRVPAVPPVVALAGVGVLVLAVGVEAALPFLGAGTAPATTVLALAQTAWVVQLVGAALLGLWVVGRVGADPDRAARRDDAEAGLDA